MSEAAGSFSANAAPGFWMVTLGIIALAVGLAAVLRRIRWI